MCYIKKSVSKSETAMSYISLRLQADHPISSEPSSPRLLWRDALGEGQLYSIYFFISKGYVFYWKREVIGPELSNDRIDASHIEKQVLIL